jgi:hypothetical protein
MNALPCRATMLPRLRCQAAKTALHVKNEELLTPKEVCCLCDLGNFADELRNLLRVWASPPLHDSHSHAPRAIPMVVGISEPTPIHEWPSRASSIVAPNQPVSRVHPHAVEQVSRRWRVGHDPAVDAPREFGLCTAAHVAIAQPCEPDARGQWRTRSFPDGKKVRTQMLTS